MQPEYFVTIFQDKAFLKIIQLRIIFFKLLYFTILRNHPKHYLICTVAISSIVKIPLLPSQM